MSRQAGRPPRPQGIAWRQQETPIAAPALAIARNAALNRQMLRWSGLLCVALALGACAPSPASPEAPAARAPAPAPALGARDTGQHDDNPPAAAAAAPAAAAPAEASEPVHEIYDAVAGRPCAPVHELGGWCAVCDRHGRTVGVVMPGDFLYLQGDDVFRRSPDTQDQSPHRLVFRVAVDARTLRAQVLTCPGCRRQIGWSIIVSIPGLTGVEPALRQRIQGALGWPAEPLLGDERAFRAVPAPASPAGQAPECPGGVLR
jgi:hypothetical protein